LEIVNDERAAPIRILIAEDDDNTRKLFGDLLVSQGHEVVASVATGADAVTETIATKPDLVLLDVHMPDGSGLDAARVISRGNPSVAVILFTGDESLVLSVADTEETSAIAFLQKPTPPRVLDAQIRLAVKRARTLQGARTDAAAARAQLEERKTIERAKGILMRRTGSSEAEAYKILQRSSQDRSVPMVEIAKAVLASEPGAGG